MMSLIIKWISGLAGADSKQEDAVWKISKSSPITKNLQKNNKKKKNRVIIYKNLSDAISVVKFKVYSSVSVFSSWFYHMLYTQW